LTANGFYIHFPQLAHLEDGFILLLGPILYFYTLSTIYKDFRFKSRHLIHILPFFVFTSLYLIYFYTLPVEKKILIEQSIINQSLPVSFYIVVTAFYFHIGLYIAISIQTIFFYRKQVKQTFSNLQKINLNWLLFLLLSVIIILLISFSQVVIALIIDKETIELALLVVTIFLFVFVNSIVFKGLKQPSIFSGISYKESHSKPKNYKEKLEKAEVEKIANDLVRVMQEDKPYLNAELNLDNLAEILAISPKKMSHTINEHFSKNFFEFINAYRITEAEKIIKESKDPGLTILEIMYLSGFNSKSSFNTTFKRTTGFTPSAYRELHLKQSS
jgi:AraC-like DNA-binding protein